MKIADKMLVMKKGDGEIILILVITTIIGLLIWNYGPKTDEELEAYLTNVNQGVEYINTMQGQSQYSGFDIQCEHEFVITSKYNWLLRSYKTISKCIKCGKTI